jgi:hypothetical protein
LTDDAKAQDNLKYDQKMTAAGQMRKHTLPLLSAPTPPQRSFVDENIRLEALPVRARDEA